PRAGWLPFATALAEHGGFDLDTPFAKLSPEHQRFVTHGTGDAGLIVPDITGRPDTRKRGAGKSEGTPGVKFQYKGLFPAIDEASRLSWVYRHRLDHLVDEVPCSACRGARIRPDAAATRFNSLSLGELT